MNNTNQKRLLLPHITAILTFVILTFLYLHPILQGQQLMQHDSLQGQGMSKEVREYREQGEEILWTSRLFSGMPTFQINTKFPNNWVVYVGKFLHLGAGGDPGLLFMLMLGFYILMIVLRINPWLSIIGAAAFAFSSYFIISLEAGHTGKLRVTGYIAPVVAGVLLVYRGRLLIGAAVTALFVSLAIASNHLQITYYLAILVGVLVITYLIYAIKNKQFQPFFKQSLILLAAAILAVGPNVSELWSTYVYSQETIRGGSSELTEKKEKSTGGLDKDYALRWSYGKMETFTLLIPEFYGGASTGELGEGSNLYKQLKKSGLPDRQVNQILKNVPLYWGDQPFTSGPVYAGAVICFFFIAGIFLVRGRMKAWIITATIVAIILSWGRHIFITDLLFEYFPMYNKFRTPSMILTLVCFTFPLLAVLAIRNIYQQKYSRDEIIKAIKYSLYISGGSCLLFLLFGGALFDFRAQMDQQLAQQGWPLDAIRDDRARLLRLSALRSLVFIILSFGAVWLLLKDKIKKQYFLAGIGLLVLVDLWAVDKNYLNKEDFETKKGYKDYFRPTQADLSIMQDPDPHYRVLNLSVNTFNDAKTSYFHESIGGYHAAKLIRYQDLIERHISQRNPAVINMLNTKYVIVKDQKTGQPKPVKNPDATGNTWFVENIKWVESADEEIAALNNFKPAKTAVIDDRYKEYFSGFDVNYNDGSLIQLKSFKPNHLVYTTSVKGEPHFAVFSEIYYEGSGDDWQAYIDDQPVDHIRVNYVLRGIKVPAGNHTIEFKFEPISYYMGEKISLAFSILLMGFIVFAFGMKIKKKVEEDRSQEIGDR